MSDKEYKNKKYVQYLKSQLRNKEKEIAKLTDFEFTNIYVNIESQNSWIRNCFEDNVVSLNEIFGVIEDLIIEIDKLKQDITDLKAFSECDIYDDYDQYMDIKLMSE